MDFTQGVSATLELARQIPKIAGFTRLDRGLTVNVGIVGGGTRTNVVAEHISRLPLTIKTMSRDFR